jgi:alkyl hydroperoxide reductase subunit AhpC
MSVTLTSGPLPIGSIAPDFEAATTEGPIRFYEWLGDSWGVLFSHPKDFTPVCTTELGYMAKIKSEFDRRGVKIMGLSVDPLESHKGWSKDIEETQGTAPNYPMIADAELKVSKLYGMLPADAGESSTGRTAMDNQTVRNVYVIGPDKKVKLLISYPMSTGRNFDEVLGLGRRMAPAGGLFSTSRRGPSSTTVFHPSFTRSRNRPSPPGRPDTTSFDSYSVNPSPWARVIHCWPLFEYCNMAMRSSPSESSMDHWKRTRSVVASWTNQLASGASEDGSNTPTASSPIETL